MKYLGKNKRNVQDLFKENSNGKTYSVFKKARDCKDVNSLN